LLTQPFFFLGPSTKFRGTLIAEFSPPLEKTVHLPLGTGRPTLFAILGSVWDGHFVLFATCWLLDPFRPAPRSRRRAPGPDSVRRTSETVLDEISRHSSAEVRVRGQASAIGKTPLFSAVTPLTGRAPSCPDPPWGRKRDKVKSKGSCGKGHRERDSARQRTRVGNETWRQRLRTCQPLRGQVGEIRAY